MTNVLFPIYIKQNAVNSTSLILKYMPYSQQECINNMTRLNASPNFVYFLWLSSHNKDILKCLHIGQDGKLAADYELTLSKPNYLFFKNMINITESYSAFTLTNHIHLIYYKLNCTTTKINFSYIQCFCGNKVISANHCIQPTFKSQSLS